VVKIAALGGEPAARLRVVPPIEQPREMLENALAAEKQAIADYVTRIRQTEGFGDVGLNVALENLAAGETRHKEEIERLLAGWNELSPGRT